MSLDITCFGKSAPCSGKGSPDAGLARGVERKAGGAQLAQHARHAGVLAEHGAPTGLDIALLDEPALARFAPDEQLRAGAEISLDGDLRLTEFISVDYDPNNNVIIGGAQDNGFSRQSGEDLLAWEHLIQGERDKRDELSALTTAIAYAYGNPRVQNLIAESAAGMSSDQDRLAVLTALSSVR